MPRLLRSTALQLALSLTTTLSLASQPVVAQQGATPALASAAPASPYATRAALQAALDSADGADASLDRNTRVRRKAEAVRLRRRLQQGDFSPGDRIVLSVDGQPALSDTFAVRSGNRLELRELPALPLTGVLRSELEARVTQHLAEFVRDPRVRALPLIRIAVVGHVQRPGFVITAPDALLSDVIMLAGGPTADADMQRTAVQRGNDVRLSQADARVAIRDGWSLDALGVRAGDEVVVGRRRQTSWNQVFTTSIMALGAVATVVALIR